MAKYLRHPNWNNNYLIKISFQFRTKDIFEWPDSNLADSKLWLLPFIRKIYVQKVFSWYCCWLQTWFKRSRGADLGFSRGGDSLENFVDIFLGRPKLIFWALPKHCFAPYFGKIFLRRRQIFGKKKQSKKAFLGTFWKILTKKNYVFSARAPPLKISKYWRRKPFRKFFRVVGRPKVDLLKKYQRGDPFGSAGCRIPEERASAPRPLNLSLKRSKQSLKFETRFSQKGLSSLRGPNKLCIFLIISGFPQQAKNRIFAQSATLLFFFDIFLLFWIPRTK